MRHLFISVALCLGWFVPPSSLASPAGDALKSLLSLKMQTECCITQRAYLKAYAKTRTQLQRFLKSPQQNYCPEFSAILVEIIKHYERVSAIISGKSGSFICVPEEIAKYRKLYPAAGRGSDHQGALVRGPQGQECLADSLLIQIIFQQAAQDIQAHGLLLPSIRDRFKCLAAEP